MLGAVQLPPGGLPCLPSLTHLEFYLPDERNWGECVCVWGGGFRRRRRNFMLGLGCLCLGLIVGWIEEAQSR
jgi:hypothetical protein